MDSQFYHQFQNNTSSSQEQSQQNDEPINYEKMLEAMTQAQNARNHDIDMMVQLYVLTVWPVLISLTILLESKSHVVLKNRVPF